MFISQLPPVLQEIKSIFINSRSHHPYMRAAAEQQLFVHGVACVCAHTFVEGMVDISTRSNKRTRTHTLSKKETHVEKIKFILVFYKCGSLRYIRISYVYGVCEKED